MNTLMHLPLLPGIFRIDNLLSYYNLIGEPHKEQILSPTFVDAVLELVHCSLRRVLFLYEEVCKWTILVKVQ